MRKRSHCFAGIAVLAFLAGPFSASLVGQSLDTVPTAAFDTLSIKRSSNSHRHHVETDAKHFAATSWTLQQIIQFAYGVPFHFQVVGAPEWVDSSYYDIDARMSTGANTTTPAEPGHTPQYPAIQALLRDRFGLIAHIERRPIPALALVVAKGGAKLKPASSGSHADPGIHNGPVMGELEGSSATIEMLSVALRRFAPTPLIYDMTGLSGAYDFTLHWNPASDSGVPIGPTAYREPNPNLGKGFDTQCLRGQVAGSCVLDNVAPSLSAALREELGLDLQVLKPTPVYTLVIDRISKPSTD